MEIHCSTRKSRKRDNRLKITFLRTPAAANLCLDGTGHKRATSIAIEKLGPTINKYQQINIKTLNYKDHHQVIGFHHPCQLDCNRTSWLPIQTPKDLLQVTSYKIRISNKTRSSRNLMSPIGKSIILKKETNIAKARVLPLAVSMKKYSKIVKSNSWKSRHRFPIVFWHKIVLIAKNNRFPKNPPPELAAKGLWRRIRQTEKASASNPARIDFQSTILS